MVEKVPGFQPRPSADGECFSLGSVELLSFVVGGPEVESELRILQRTAAHADEVSFQGKTITVYIGAPPGGGYDLYGRLVSQFIGKHIPGQPAVIASNRPGGKGGLDIWIAHWNGNGWDTPVNAGPKINTGADEFCPSPARGNRTPQNEKRLMAVPRFLRGRPGPGYGGVAGAGSELEG